MSNQIIFIDSNIWLYRFLSNQDPNPEEDARKRKIAIQLTNQKNIVITVQVINEVCYVLKRKTNLSEIKILQLIEEFEEQCLVMDLSTSIIKKASLLREKYNLSFWDSLIVESALSASVSILYSEDMQHNLTINNQLIIINPFKK